MGGHSYQTNYTCNYLTSIVVSAVAEKDGMKQDQKLGSHLGLGDQGGLPVGSDI